MWKFNVTVDWARFLLNLYKEFRSALGWNNLYASHDQEDQAYFDVLDEFYDSKKEV